MVKAKHLGRIQIGGEDQMSDFAWRGGAESATETAQTESTAADNEARIRLVVAASMIGTIIEWYDFFVYGTAAALVFAPLFFSNASSTVGTLAAFTTYALGFAVRPIGGAVFGHLGDKFGRKAILVTTLMVMGITTTLIGVLPTYGQIGEWAPILLLMLRLVQGFGAGAEFAGAAILAVEFSPPQRRGFFGSWSQIGVAIGLAAAVGVFWLAQQLPEADFMSWGWRIPFLASAIVLLVGLWIRARIGESPIFKRIQTQNKLARSPLIEVLKTQPKSLLLVLGMRFADNAVLYIPVVFTLSYLKLHVHLSGNVGLIGVFLAAAAQVIFIPLFGSLSDRVGRRIIYGGGALVAAVLMIPYFWLIDSANPWAVWFAITLLGGCVYAAMAGSQPAFFSELFPPHVRYTGVAGAREFGAIAGGAIPLAAAALAAAYSSATPVAVLVICMCLVTVGAVALAPETRGRHIDVEADPAVKEG
jgi:MFS transporter, MHS family, shikimate and dehydroshikimate transport protein